jgi:osmotically-inducible protein OsmY
MNFNFHKMTKFFFFTLLGFCALGMSGCMTTSSSSKQTSEHLERSDLFIQSGLDVEYFKLDLAFYHQVCIKVYKGRVLLSGHVPSQKLKEQAVKIAKGIQGVKEVIDVMVVAPPRDLSSYLSDSWIATAIAARMVAEKNYDSTKYVVEVVDGIAYLLGESQTANERLRAVEMSRQIAGVKKVVSYIAVKSSKPSKTVSSHAMAVAPVDSVPAGQVMMTTHDDSALGGQGAMTAYDTSASASAGPVEIINHEDSSETVQVAVAEGVE